MNKFKREIPERAFMCALLKHTGIALALLIPLAAYSTFSRAETGLLTSERQIGSDLQVVQQPYKVAPISNNKPHSITNIDLNKYAGQWYEIARFPMYFQRNCIGDVIANYKLNRNATGKLESVDVLNECRKADGTLISAEGLAKPANSSGSELKVTFLPKLLRWLPVGKADYWVLDIDKNYQNALVGTPDNKYLWVLSRTPTLSQSKFNSYKSIAKSQGYDISKLQVTTHSGVPSTLISQ